MVLFANSTPRCVGVLWLQFCSLTVGSVEPGSKVTGESRTSGMEFPGTDSIINSIGAPLRELSGPPAQAPLELTLGFAFPPFIGGRPDIFTFNRTAHIVLDEINADPKVLNQTKLKMVVHDTKCSMLGGAAVAYAMSGVKPGFPIKAVGWVGAACSDASKGLAVSAPAWKIPQISFVSSAADLSDKKQFPYFMRLAAPNTAQAKCTVQFLAQMGWKVIGAVASQEPKGQQGINGVIKGVTASGGIVRVTQYFPAQDLSANNTELVAAVQVIKNSGVRIVVNYATPWNTKHFLSACSQARLFGVPYIHFTMEMTLDAIDDTFAGPALFDQLEGTYGIGTFTGAGLKNAVWMSKMESLGSNPTVGGVSYLYDIFWIFARVLDETILTGGDPHDGEGLLQRLYKFTHDEGFSFSGKIAFNKDGDRIPPYYIMGVRDGMYKKAALAEFNVSSSEWQFVKWYFQPHFPGNRTTAPPDVPPQCDAGKYPQGWDSCTSCPGGKYTAESGMTACIDCGSGTYGSNAGQTSCTACTGGSVSSTSGATACSECIPGKFADEPQQTRCRSCILGTHASYKGSSSCSDCAIGKYSEVPMSGNCTKCETDFTTIYPGSTSGNFCQCPDNYYRSEGSCVACVEGMDCEWTGPNYIVDGGVNPIAINTVSGNQTLPYISPGFYASSAAPLLVYRCHPTRVDAACAGGDPRTQNLCHGLRSGLICHACPSGYTKDRAGGCVFCGSGRTVPGVLAFILLVVTSALGYKVAVKRRLVKAKAMDACAAILSMSVQTLQILAVLGISAIVFPTDVERNKGVVKLFALDLDILGLECSFNLVSSFGKFVASAMVLPISILTMLLAFLLASQTAIIKHQGKRWTKAGLLQTIGSVTQMAFITLCSIAMTPISCFGHPNGYQSIQKYPEIRCFHGAEHALFIAFGLFCLVIAILFYSLVLFAIWNVRALAQRHGTDFFIATLFLFNRFTLSALWFPVWLLPRGFFLSLVFVLAPNDVRAQLLMILIVLLVHTSLVLYVKPWKVPVANILDASLSVLVIIMLAACTSRMPASRGSQGGWDSLIIICLSMLLFVLVPTVLAAMYSVATDGKQGDLLPMFALRRKRLTEENIKDTVSALLRMAQTEGLQNSVADWQHADVSLLAGVVSALQGYNENTTEGFSKAPAKLSVVITTDETCVITPHKDKEDFTVSL